MTSIFPRFDATNMSRKLVKPMKFAVVSLVPVMTLFATAADADLLGNQRIKRAPRSIDIVRSNPGDAVKERFHVVRVCVEWGPYNGSIWGDSPCIRYEDRIVSGPTPPGPN